MSASGGSGDAWTLHATDRALIGNKTGATRLGFAVLLKLFAAEGRFPRCAEVLLAYRRRVGTEELYELRRHPDPIRLTLLAAFYHVRGREIADTLTDLLITTVHRIGAKAEKGVVQIRVTRETWSPLVGAALATFSVTHKPPVLNHAPGCIPCSPACARTPGTREGTRPRRPPA